METEGKKITGFARYYDSFCSLIPNLKNFYIQNFKNMEIEKKKIVLDLGCGTGTPTLIAGKLNPDCKIFGVDPSLQMLARAEIKLGKTNSNIIFQEGVAENLPFDNDTFDLIYSFEVFHHLPEEIKRKALSEVERVLKPGGLFFLNDFCRPNLILLQFLTWPLSMHKHSKSNFQGLLPQLVEESEMKVIEIDKSLGGLIWAIQAIKL